MSKQTEISGFQKQVLVSINRNRIYQTVDELIQDGWEIHKATSKIQWPFFWIREYRVKMRKHFLFVDEEIVYYSKKEIDNLK